VSLRELNQAGMLLPRHEWGRHDLHTTVNKVALVLALLLGLVSVILMYASGGRWPTFLGIVLFLVFMGWITYISIMAVRRQATQFAEEREEIAEAPTLPPDAPPDTPMNP